MIVIVDLEHCLSNASHRMHLKGKDNHAFQMAFRNDSLNEDMKIFMDQLIKNGKHEVAILSAKLTKYNDIVFEWLTNNEISYHWLIMKQDENQSDLEFKEDYVIKIKRQGQILMAFDDVGANCAMFAKHGIPALRITQK